MPKSVKNGRVVSNRDKRIDAKLARLAHEVRSTPRVRAAKADPPPVSSGKSLYINRRVRIVKTLSTSSQVTVDDIKGETSSGPFKILNLSAWTPGSNTTTFALQNVVWENDGAVSMTYRDTAPANRLCGVTYDIPDQLASILNTGAEPVIIATPVGTVTGQLIVDVTVRYQI